MRPDLLTFRQKSSDDILSVLENIEAIGKITRTKTQKILWIESVTELSDAIKDKIYILMRKVQSENLEHLAYDTIRKDGPKYHEFPKDSIPTLQMLLSDGNKELWSIFFSHWADRFDILALNIEQ